MSLLTICVGSWVAYSAGMPRQFDSGGAENRSEMLVGWQVRATLIDDIEFSYLPVSNALNPCCSPPLNDCRNT